MIYGNHCPENEGLILFISRTVENTIFMKRLFFSSILFVAALGLAASAAFFVPTAKAQDINDTLSGLNQSANQVNAFKEQAKDNTGYGTDFLNTKVGQIVGLVLSFVGVVFLALMIYAGIRWMTAGGNESTISEAKSLILNAIIGIVVVFAAYAITDFVGTELLTR